MTDLFRTIGNLLEMTFLAVESAYFDVERFWRGFKKFVAISIFSPILLFILAYIFQSSILIIISGIMLAISLALILLPFTALVSVIGMVRRKSEGLASRYLKFVSAVILWELLIVFYCTILPIWQNPKGVLVAGVGAVIIALAGVVWGAGYITWFRKVAIFFVVVIFIFQTLTLIFPQTTNILRERFPKSIDKKIADWITKEKISGELTVADVNYDGIVDSFDIQLINRFLVDPTVFPDSSRGDVNGDNRIDSIDVRYLNDYLFHKGPPPKAAKRNLATERTGSQDKMVEKETKFDTLRVTVKGNTPYWTIIEDYNIPGNSYITFYAKGKIRWETNPQIDEQWVGPDGASWTPSQVSYPEQFLLPHEPIASLIGWVGRHPFIFGKDQPFGIGSYRTIKIQEGGTLHLGFNDRWRRESWLLNEGQVEVILVVQKNN